MKNKKTLTSLVVLVAALAVFAVSAFAAAGNLSAYQKMKNNLISSMNNEAKKSSIDSMTNETNISVFVDGKVFMSSKTTAKTDKTSFSTYTEMTENGTTKTSSNESVVKDGTMYSVSRNDDGTVSGHKYDFEESNFDTESYTESFSNNSISDSQVAFVSALIDTVVGDAKNYFYDNGDVIGAKLEGGQIPELIQLGLNAVIEESKNDRNTYGSNTHGMDEILKLKNLRVISIMGEVASPFDIENATGNGEVVFAGLDGNNKQVEIKLTFDTKVFDIGKTVVEPSNWDGIEFKNFDDEVLINDAGVKIS